jgi:starvation-inducible DNA-binding protein
MSKNAARNSNTQMAKHLANVVSDTYLLMIKTHGYHWNITGPEFHQLHLLLEEQYKELFAAVDEVAERMRALDLPAPGSPGAFKNHTAVKDAPEQPPSTTAMLKDLVKTHEHVRERIEEGRAFASEIGDNATEDMLIGRLKAHDKTLWMLRSQLA